MKLNAVMAGLVVACAHSVAVAAESPAISVILDGYYQDGDRALGAREDGFGLGETELALSGAIDDQFYGKATVVLATEGRDTEVELEEAFIQTLALPAGFSMRAGRFTADLGYLNNQHLHTDSFVERPAVYRAFLGGHYFDDGLRLNWVAPTDVYWTLGLEGFSGDNLQAEGLEDPKSVGVYHLYSKFGGDWGTDHSWQLGLSWLRNENGQGHLEEHEEEEHAEEEAHADHGHSHSASLTGRDLYVVDAVYKWAPNGNYKNNFLTLSGEYLYMDKPFEQAGGEENIPGNYDGWYLSGVYQFNPKWSAGLRYGEVSSAMAHEEEHDGHHHIHFEDGKLKETEAMVAWHNSHFSTIRLQYTHQSDDLYESADDHIVTLQFVMALGAHGAHQF
ncbi:membrane protein [Ferrimonas kyonanensis]|uniref:membrane protein n=1 Tax=Ferrimonas kyonanensis TaxID=364763 RepID=UPI00042A72EE|nr:membrane protein [Ferrimonas kyonanensis]